MVNSHPISALIREGKIIYFQLYAEIFQRKTKIGPPWITCLSWTNHRAKKTTSSLGHVSTLAFKEIKYITEISKGCWASQKEIPMF